MKGGGDGDDAARQWWCGSAAWWWSEVGHGGELVVKVVQWLSFNLSEANGKTQQKKQRKDDQNRATYLQVDFPRPLGPISIQNCPQGMRFEQSLRTGTSCVCLVVNKNVKTIKI